MFLCEPFCKVLEILRRSTTSCHGNGLVVIGRTGFQNEADCSVFDKEGANDGCCAIVWTGFIREENQIVDAVSDVALAWLAFRGMGCDTLYIRSLRIWVVLLDIVCKHWWHLHRTQKASYDYWNCMISDACTREYTE